MKWEVISNDDRVHEYDAESEDEALSMYLEDIGECDMTHGMNPSTEVWDIRRKEEEVYHCSCGMCNYCNLGPPDEVQTCDDCGEKVTKEESAVWAHELVICLKCKVSNKQTEE